MKTVISSFDTYLAELGLRFEAVIIGGAALIILEIVDRTTRDVDCLDPEIPEAVLEASQSFAKKFPQLGLVPDWLNNGPASLKRDLPMGWEMRLQPAFCGQALIFHVLGRLDLLRSKLFAFCDRQIDLDDCIALNPTLEEMRQCLGWVVERDANPDWPDHVVKSFSLLERKLGYGLKSER